MSWTPLPALEPITFCNCCPPKPQTMPLGAHIHPGFGAASVYAADAPEMGQDMYEIATMQDVEDFAWAHGASEHDWRLSIDAPLYSAVYQRQGEGVWVLVERGQGFA